MSSRPATLKSRAFFWKRLHGLTGVVPVGTFVAFHLWANARSLRGPAVFDAEVSRLEATPFLVWIEMLFIVLPLAFHGLYGVWLAMEADNNVLRYGYFRNWMFYLQRASGFVALVFIGYHYWAFRLSNWLWGRPITYATVASDLRQPAIFAVYAIGVLAVAFHLANGLWNFAIDWGIAVGPRARRQLTYGMAAVFAAIAGMGLAAMIGFVR